MVISSISRNSIPAFFVELNPCIFGSDVVFLSQHQEKRILMNQKLRNLVYTAMLMALCCVATLVIKIPTVTGGYLNAGDIVVVLAALLAGPLYGGVAAGFGSGLADVISGYMSYAPGTLVVKGCAAVVAALIFRACRKKNFGFALLSAICGEIIMVLGYFVFEDFILGYGLAAAGEIPGNACQAAVGVAGGLALYFALSKVPQLREFAESVSAKKEK
ncbi:MAG: ECF transporter S component [Clostridiales bacterium]|nr:ECF transporter S component [Clostridiales bacterium]